MTKSRKTVRKPAIRAAITGVHGYVPPDVLTNAELAQMVDTSDEWITERTGIKERRILKGKGSSVYHHARTSCIAQFFLVSGMLYSADQLVLTILALLSSDRGSLSKESTACGYFESPWG